MIYTDLFQTIEQDILAYLQSDAVMGLRSGTLLEPGAVESSVANKVNQAIGAGPDGKVGIGFVVLAIEDLIDDMPEVNFGPLKIPVGVHIVENVLLNNGPRGAKIPIRVLAAYGQKILKPYSATNLITDLVPDNAAISLFTKHDDENIRFCAVNFHTYESDPVPFTQVSSPFLTPSAPVSSTPGQNVYPMSVTIAAPDADEVWWSIDGSNPWAGLPANADANFKGIQTAAVKWDGNPVKIAGPCFFRARGFRAGNVGSKTSSIFFP